MAERDRRAHAGWWQGLLVVGFAGTAGASGLPWEIWESPQRFAALDVGQMVISHSSQCPDGCRYDRSLQGPEPIAANPYPLRWLYREGNEVVLLDERGPGALTRIWMTTGDGVSRCIDPAIRVRFRFDGEAVPRMDVPLASLFDGSMPPFTAPMVADRTTSSGGYVSHVPIPFARSLRISLVDVGLATNPCDPSGWGLLWHQFQVHRLKPGAEVTSFTPTTDWPRWRTLLSGEPGDDPWNGMLEPVAFSHAFDVSSEQILASRAGNAWLRGIRLSVPPSARTSVRLRLHVDGETTVDMPVADFFAAAQDAAARSLLTGEGEDGVLYAWWPMPYASSIEVALVVEPSAPFPLTISGSLHFDESPAPTDGTRFEATRISQCTSAGALRLFDRQGAGKIVGMTGSYRADAVIGRGYLEGDERAYVDGANTPAWYGTGVEDFFDGGFYFDQGPFRWPLSGAPSVDPDGQGHVFAYRVFATDPMVYSSALRLTQEAGYSPGEPFPTCARHVVYGYHRDRPGLVSYARFDVGDATQAAWHAHEPLSGSSCAAVSGRFEDEPPTARSAIVCRGGAGTSRMRFRVPPGATSLRLRRTIDVGLGTPGALAGAPAAQVLVDGVAVGWFPLATANPSRRWQQQEALLGVSPVPGWLELEIAHEPDGHAAAPNESAWELRGAWVDALFNDGFEPGIPP